MAEGIKHSEESVKLFVGQVPKQMTEEQLLAMFKEFALVDEVNIIKDKTTRASRGCCFVLCPSREEADKAVNAYHNKRTLPGASSPLQVKYADGELERLEHKLFVGMLPKNVSDAELYALFSEYGTVKDLQILRGSQQTSKGCSFLKYETKEQALAAIEALNGKHKMEGSSVPLVVKWADTEKERQARRAQKAQPQASNVPNTNSAQHPSLFGSLTMGYIPSYSGYGYQTPGTYGLMQYRLPSVQNQPAFHNVVPPVNQGNALRGVIPDLVPGMATRNYAIPPASYVGSAYPGVPGLQYPMAYPGGMMSNRPLSGSASVSPATVNSPSAASSSVSGSFGGQVEGPPGANLFIYHIPQEFGDQELANAFQPFGRVLSAKVFVDKATGVSKCFGFVSYDSVTAAQSAIDMMNGCQLGGKKLKGTPNGQGLISSMLFTVPVDHTYKLSWHVNMTMAVGKGSSQDSGHESHTGCTYLKNCFIVMESNATGNALLMSIPSPPKQQKQPLPHELSLISGRSTGTSLGGEMMNECRHFMLLQKSAFYRGDSEAISELNIAAVDAELMGAAEDDALSCSCDDLMDCELGKFDDLGHTHDEVYHVADHGDEEDEDIDQDWTDGGDDEDDDEVVMSSTAKAREHKKLRVCVDSAMELMNEMEKSRLFWEACLAS
ncbi:RNA-binding protein BRN1 [Camellia lanceoleosa]|uniref:RNA-binding protein BRN1 n=1 Tax=Camellia lanceoleosa TaxID=1840588 RepID=A0ACC0F481_9ERIC|nr:RNA-binding protein BRN1 [Camellia lanceoleosa]